MIPVGPVVVRAQIVASRDSVWAALVQQDWYAELNFDCELSGQATVSGARQASGKVDVWVPGHVLGFKWETANEKPTAVLITLRSRGDSTDLTLTETGFDALENGAQAAAAAQLAWDAAFAKLAESNFSALAEQVVAGDNAAVTAQAESVSAEDAALVEDAAPADDTEQTETVPDTGSEEPLETVEAVEVSETTETTAVAEPAEVSAIAETTAAAETAEPVAAEQANPAEPTDQAGSTDQAEPTEQPEPATASETPSNTVEAASETAESESDAMADELSSDTNPIPIVDPLLLPQPPADWQQDSDPSISGRPVVAGSGESPRVADSGDTDSTAYEDSDEDGLAVFEQLLAGDSDEPADQAEDNAEQSEKAQKKASQKTSAGIYDDAEAKDTKKRWWQR